MADTVSVTQEDATFVADILEIAETLNFDGNDVVGIRNGLWNDEPNDLGRLLRMAAKYRLASTQPAPAFPREEVERVVETALYNSAMNGSSAEVCVTAREITDAIDALLQGKQP